jgi:hypothetical protein
MIQSTEIALRELRPLIEMPVNLSPDFFDKDMVTAKLRAIDIQTGLQVKVDDNAIKKKELDDITPVLNRLNEWFDREKKEALLIDITPAAATKET